jgi:uncharacterized membrane protein YesL
MILFFIKKSFFDGWDNLFRLIIVNAPFSALIGAEAMVAYVMLSARNGAPLSIVEFLILTAGFVLVSLYSGASAWFVNKIADFDSPGFRDFFEGFKKTAARSALFGLLASLLTGLIFLCLSYYGARKDILGSLAMGLVFWGGLFCLVSFQWFHAIMVRLEGNLFKLVKKCFLISLDNLGFSIFIGIWTLLMGILSILTAGFVPGPAGIQLALCDALKLRAYKYDWLEKNPGVKRNAVPWKDLIAEDEEFVGPRSLRSMIFPWKDMQK